MRARRAQRAETERARRNEAIEEASWTKIDTEEVEEDFEHVELDEQFEVLTGSESESESDERDWEYDADSESYPVLRRGMHWDRDDEDDDANEDEPRVLLTQNGSEALQARKEADTKHTSETEVRKSIRNGEAWEAATS